MSAPKPKVVRNRFRFWDWRCGCGGSSWEVYVRHADALHAAIKHSHRHAAERIADQLDEWAGELTDNSSDRAYWQGYLEGAAQAQRDVAQLIRECLVGRTP